MAVSVGGSCLFIFYVYGIDLAPIIVLYASHREEYRRCAVNVTLDAEGIYRVWDQLAELFSCIPSGASLSKGFGRLLYGLCKLLLPLNYILGVLFCGTVFRFYVNLS